MTCIADATVLFALLVQGHAAHQVARDWWSEQPDGGVGTCILTGLEVLRHLTSSCAMRGHPVSAQLALDAWDRLSNDPRCFYINSPPIQELPRFAAMVTVKSRASTSWDRAWLAAFAMSLDYELVTFDPTYQAFRGLRPRLLHAARASETFGQPEHK